MDAFETEKAGFVLNTFRNRQPVKGVKQGSHVVGFPTFEYKPGCIVLDTLEREN